MPAPVRSLCLALLASPLVLAGYRSLPPATPYRDLNKNGKLDVYEDCRQPLEARVSNLLSQMTLAEKAGMLFIAGAKVPTDGSLADMPVPGVTQAARAAAPLICTRRLTHFNIWNVPDNVQALAVWQNNVQRFAQDSTRLGIPITIASDPRNHLNNNIFAVVTHGVSQWCETLGLAAIGDDKLTRQFAETSRQEYLAVGIRQALHPQVDLATEPRWARISGTFGEDANLTARLATQYILGYQGAALGSQSVACMTKHFSGGGPQKEGLDPHFEFQKGQVYPGNNFKYHLIPFEAAFKAGTAAIMPYYGVPTGQTPEEVGFAYDKAIITGLLRDKYHFDGVVCTNWGLITDATIGTTSWPARAWGVESLSREQRVKKLLAAGVDQFGGELSTELVRSLVQSGQVPESRLDVSVRRLLRQKFQLGLFDNPFVYAAKAAQLVGQPAFRAAGEASQRRAMTLLQNNSKALPLQPGKWKIYVQNLDPKVAAAYGTVVATPKEADFAIIRLKAPWYPVDTKNAFAKGFHHGDLDFKGQEKADMLNLLATVPTIVDLYLDRPAVVPEISRQAKALLADFGASDAAVLNVIFGKAQPEGKLPFKLPSSMEAVRQQKEDLPYDSKYPLYKLAFGLHY